MTTDPRPVRNFRMELSFDGTAYHGWQRQANGISVQEVVENKLSHLFNTDRIRIQGSSRTDSGVHALGMAASFEAPESPYIPDWKIKKAMNRLLPPDIRIRSVDYAAPDFNARFSAKGKAYIYVVNTGDLNPFTSRWSHYQPEFVQLDAVRDSMKMLEGTHDFSAFTIELDPEKDHVRTLYRLDLKQFGPLVCMCFVGNGFLYKMVRSMTGALLEVGRGRMPAARVGEMLASQNRSMAKDTAPACGLFLMKVFYEDDEWRSFDFDTPPFFVL
ncbi:MAG: tRNA pseudouridine(38-40) synthase TruA [Lentisphaeria bacterium]|nr:tRNA pseudouridine(38-40) synthase TruA [Lentisphaeria bacterium]